MVVSWVESTAPLIRRRRKPHVSSNRYLQLSARLAPRECARIWGEWFAALAGGVYLPFEIYELGKGVTPVRLGLFALNLGIVTYLARQLWLQRNIGTI